MTQPEGYEPLLGGPPDAELGRGVSNGQTWRPASPFGAEHPEDLLGEEEGSLTWAAVHNLDDFFSQLYRYWDEKGFVVIMVARILNLAALAFTIFASGVLLLGIDYSQLHAECLKEETCNLWDVAVIKHPLAGPLTLWKLLSVTYLTIFAGYWAFAAAHLFQEVRGLAEVRHFLAEHVGMSERALRAATWPEIAARLVAAQRSVRLCISKDLTEHDIVSRIMRRDNYLIGMLNQGVLALNVPLPGLHRHVLLTKTVEWNLRWCVLDPMFDDSTFRIRQAFLQDVESLQRRFRTMAIINALFSPFLLVFLLIYFFMKNAETLYHHPSSIGARRWSPVARWSLREFNELPHFISHRLNAGHAAAERYIAQFPNYAISHIARFIAFVAGSFAAVLIALTLVDERLLERDFVAHRQTVWWLALLGVVLAAARALIIEPSVSAFDPGLALLEVAAHTHYLPRHWRGRAHTLEVQEEFQTLFRYRASLFLEELWSVLLAPVLLWHSLPRCAGAILSFVENNTTTVEGVGDVCSQAAFHLSRHRSDLPFGSPESRAADAAAAGGTVQAPEGTKLEKSLVGFAAAYPSWNPPAEAQDFLSQVAAEGGPAPLGAAEGDDGAPFGSTSAFGNVLDSTTAAVPSVLGSLNDPWRFNTTNIGSTDPLLSLLTSRYPHFAKVYLATHHHGGLASKVEGLSDPNAGNSNNGGSGGSFSMFRRAGYSQQHRGGAPTAGASLFASAEAVARGGGLSHGLGYPVTGPLFMSATAGAGGGNEMPPDEERVMIGQALLQSFHDRLFAEQTQQQDIGINTSLQHARDGAAGSSGAGMQRQGSVPRAVPAPTSGLARSISNGGTPGSYRYRAGSGSPYASPGGSRPLREKSSELSVISRDASEAVELPASPAAQGRQSGA